MSEELSYRERLALIRSGMAEKTTGAKPRKAIPKVSKKRLSEAAQIKEAGGDNEMWDFFLAMRKKMTGKCLFTGAKSLKHDDEMFHFSIAHLLEKRYFKSVSTNPDNWIELSWDAHTDFDNGKISWLMLKDSKEWEIIKEKLLNVLPAVAMEERKHKLYSKLTTLVYGIEPTHTR